MYYTRSTAFEKYRCPWPGCRVSEKKLADARAHADDHLEWLGLKFKTSVAHLCHIKFKERVDVELQDALLWRDCMSEPYFIEKASKCLWALASKQMPSTVGISGTF